MRSDVLVALLALFGSLAGTFGGIFATGKLTNHRLQELEKKVDKHNNVIERIYVLEEKVRVANHRIDDLEVEGG